MTRKLINLYKCKMNKRDKSGGEAIGTALSTVFIMMLLLIPIGLFVYLMPRITLEQDVQQFTNSIRLDGYVSSAVYGEFKEKMKDRGYTEDELNLEVSDPWLKVYATDIPPSNQGGNYVNGANLIQSPTNLTPPVVSRGNGKIAIQVKLPANSGIFVRSVEQMNNDDESEESKQQIEEIKDTVRYYKIGKEIMSEAYGGPGGGNGA